MHSFVPLLGAECDEQEPNNTFAEANLLQTNQLRRKTLSANWRTSGELPNAQTGDLVFALADPLGSSGSLDTFLEVIADDGTTFLESDSNSGSAATPLAAAVATVTNQAANVSPKHNNKAPTQRSPSTGSGKPSSRPPTLSMKPSLTTRPQRPTG